MSDPASRPYRRWLLTAGKLAIAAVVVVFVVGSVRDAARQLAEQPVRPDWRWLGVSAVAYIVGLLPMAWFWRQALASLGQPSGWRLVLPGYYLGHLGKYVPGKALVVVLRTGAIRRAGGQASAIAASVFVETLTFMAVGGALASLLLFAVEPVFSDDAPLADWLGELGVALAAVAVVPTLPPVMSWALAKTGAHEAADAATGLSWRLLASGWAAGALAWLAVGVSLWACVRALCPSLGFTSEAVLAATLAACLPVVAGFLSLLPGGVLVRDGLMFTLLRVTPGVDDATALAATLVVRLVWITSEAAACAILVVTMRPPTKPPTSRPEPLA